MSIKNLLFAACIAALALKNAFAVGVTVNPGEFVVENLKIGQSYDISKMAQPFKIKYQGPNGMDMVIDVYPPNDPRPGYEPIPDKSWVKLDKEFYSALSGEEVTVIAVLTIPNDEKYLGKKYDVRLKVSARAKGEGWGVAVLPAVETRILFSIFREKGSAEDQAKFDQEILKTRNISFTPTEVVLNGVPVGRKVDIKKELKQSLKLTNLNDEPIRIILKCVLPKDIGLQIPGYESMPDKDMLTFAREKIKIGSNQVEEVKLYLNFPDKAEFHNKKFLVICEASIDSEVFATQYRTRLFITTK